jgi:hypothetical protein
MVFLFLSSSVLTGIQTQNCRRKPDAVHLFISDHRPHVKRNSLPSMDNGPRGALAFLVFFGLRRLNHDGATGVNTFAPNGLIFLYETLRNIQHSRIQPGLGRNCRPPGCLISAACSFQEACDLNQIPAKSLASSTAVSLRQPESHSDTAWRHIDRLQIGAYNPAAARRCKSLRASGSWLLTLR